MVSKTHLYGSMKNCNVGDADELQRHIQIPLHETHNY